MNKISVAFLQNGNREVCVQSHSTQRFVIILMWCENPDVCGFVELRLASG